MVNVDQINQKITNGFLAATKTGDVDYPGIDVEYVRFGDEGEELSRPRVLIEECYGNLRVLIWDDPESEDYTREIVLCKLY